MTTIKEAYERGQIVAGSRCKTNANGMRTVRSYFVGEVTMVNETQKLFTVKRDDEKNGMGDNGEWVICLVNETGKISVTPFCVICQHEADEVEKIPFLGSDNSHVVRTICPDCKATLPECDECGAPSTNKTLTHDGKTLCPECWDHKKCSICRGYHVVSELKDGLCEKCQETHFICDKCGTYHSNNTKVEVDGGNYCSPCFEIYYRTCGCGAIQLSSRMRVVKEHGEEKFICRACFDLTYAVCGICGKTERKEKTSPHHTRGNVCFKCAEKFICSVPSSEEEIVETTKMLLEVPTFKTVVVKLEASYTEEDTYVSEIAIALGVIQKPIHIFGLKNREELQIWVSNDVYLDLKKLPECSETGSISTPAGVAILTAKEERRDRAIGLPLILREVEENRNWVINTLKTISCVNGKESV